jgi:predicted alpha/beta superfamily hydrolase
MFAMLLGVQAVFAEPQPAVIPGTEVSLLESKSTGQTYRITVYAPPKDPAAVKPPVYPVVYVLDGLWHFARVESLRSALVFDGQMPEVIVVAVDYPAPVPEVLKLRQKDLTFGSAADPGPAGGAPAFLEFLTAELAPWVEARYPANPAERVLLGHSYAGHFALYAWAAKPGFYGRVLAASPYWNTSLRDWLERDAPPAAAGACSRLVVASGVAGLEYADCVLKPEYAAIVTASRARLGLAGDTRFALFPDLKHAAIAHTIYAHGVPWLFASTPGGAETLGWTAGLGAKTAPVK